MSLWQKIKNWFASLKPSQPVAPTAPPEPVKPVEIVKPNALPTREEMLSVFLGMCDGAIPTRVGAYKQIRETHGSNRSPAIDKIIQAQGGELGNPYCQFGLQEALDELCRYYGIERKQVKIPEGGSTQTVWTETPTRFKLVEPRPMCWVTWRKGTTWTGHVGMCVGHAYNKRFKTFEFNTTAVGDEVVRDGQGAGYLVRYTDGTTSMKIRGYIDVYSAISEAIIAAKGVSA